MSEIDDIKNRLDVIDVISEYMQLKQAGANWKGLCPFHNEKTPSFMASRDKQIWHCFGCGEGGDIFGFIQKIEGMEFPEALRILADKAGVKLNNVNIKAKNEKTKLMDASAMAVKFFQAVLQNDLGKIAREYLEKRNVSQDSIEDFCLGYSPDSWDSLLNALEKKGFSEKEIFLAGLTVKKEKGVGYYDRFRGRLMFPIADAHGNVVGFTARILGKEVEGVGKYINTPATAIYNKSNIIYGLHKAKQAIKKENLAVLVEGNMDVITSHAAGIQNVAATSGTAMTIEQIKLLKRYTNNIALAFDADPAGQGAVERGIDIALGEGVNVRVIEIPGGKDPDECIKSSAEGPKLWKEAIEKSESIMEYYFKKVFSKFDLAKVEDKKKAGDILLGRISKIGNKIEQTHWLQKLSEAINVSESVLLESLPKNKPQVKRAEEAIKPPEKKSKDDLISEELLAVLLRFPKSLPRFIEAIMPEMIKNSEFSELYKKIVYHYTKNNSFDLKEFRKNANEAEKTLMDRLELLADKDFSENEKKDEIVENLISIFLDNYKRQKRGELQNSISAAEKKGDHGETVELMKELQRISEK